MKTSQLSKKTFIISLIWLVVVTTFLGCQSTTYVNKTAEALNYEEAKRKFTDLRKHWEEEAQQHWYLSDTKAYWQWSAGQAIIAMGKEALPFVMEEVQKGNFFFNVPAARITGISMRKEEEIMVSEQDIARRWVKWWEANRNNPEWNVFLKQ